MSEITDVMRRFPFAEVTRYMEEKRWRWCGAVERGDISGIPTEREIRDEARRLLLDAVNTGGKRDYWTECGGFRAERIDGRLLLSFDNRFGDLAEPAAGRPS